MPGPRGSGEIDRSGVAGRLLVLGASARALAASAGRSLEARRRFPGGILAIDYFGDTDLAGEARGVEGERPQAPLPQAPEVRIVSVSRDLGLPRTTASLGRAALATEWSALAYTGGLENRPGLLRLLARRKGADGQTATILGNGGKTLAAVRDPRRLFPFLQVREIPHAAVRFDDTMSPGAPPAAASAWLIKKIRSAGGAGVRAAVPRERLPPGCFLQERLSGPVGSVAFLADGREAVLLGFTEQLAGWEALGASGYRYTGNIAGPWNAFLSAKALDLLGRAARRITERFGLRGLNGLDYIVQGDLPRLIEVNPRWTASMELIEERIGRNLFDLQIQAQDGELAGDGRLALLREIGIHASPGRFLAKGILYATAACIAPEPAALLALGARDRPPRGERLAPGQPICTLVVDGDTPAACRARLREQAAAVRSLL